MTDLTWNDNKFYCMELHKATEQDKSYWRIFTHYGRTDDISKPNVCKKECRYTETQEKAEVTITAFLTCKADL